MKKVLVIISVILTIVIAGGVYLYQKNKASSAQAVQWQEFTVTRGDIAIAIDATGFVEPLEEVQIFSEIKGEVVKVFVTAGDQVKKGQTLALIDASTLLNDLAQAEAGIKQAEITLENAKTDWERLGRLEKEKIISRQQFEAGETKYLSAVESLKIAKLKKEQLLKGLDEHELIKVMKQKDYSITAPIDGVILAVNAKVGSEKVFSSGQVELPFFSMANLTNLLAVLDTDESDIGKISPGQPVTIMSSSGEQEIPATIDTVGSQGTYTNGVVVYKATAKLKDESHYLRSGMSVEAKIWLDKRENVLILPSQAVVDRNGRKMVQVMEGNEPLYRRVTVGIDDGESTEILAGLGEGDKVVVASAVPAVNNNGTRNSIPGLTPTIRGVR